MECYQYTRSYSLHTTVSMFVDDSCFIWETVATIFLFVCVSSLHILSLALIFKAKHCRQKHTLRCLKSCPHNINAHTLVERKYLTDTFILSHISPLEMQAHSSAH